MPKKYDNLETLTLIKKASAGDHGAYTEIYTRYVNRTRSLCLRLLNNEEDADDATQETFAIISTKLKSFKRKSALSTWIFRIACNSSLLIIRRRERNMVSLEGLTEDHNFATADYDQKMVLSRLILQGLIAKLPPLDRNLIEMRLLGYTQDDLVTLCGLPTTTTKSRHHRAVKAMRDHYAHQRVRKLRSSLRLESRPVS